MKKLFFYLNANIFANFFCLRHFALQFKKYIFGGLAHWQQPSERRREKKREDYEPRERRFLSSLPSVALERERKGDREREGGERGGLATHGASLAVQGIQMLVARRDVRQFDVLRCFAVHLKKK